MNEWIMGGGNGVERGAHTKTNKISSSIEFLKQVEASSV
jgi:hypothetical protein